MNVKPLALRAVLPRKWSEAPALGKTDSRLQIASGTIFVSLCQRMCYQIIIEGVLPQTVAYHGLRTAEAPLVERHCHSKLSVVQITKLATLINCLLDGGGNNLRVTACQFAGGEPLQYLR